MPSPRQSMLAPSLAVASVTVKVEPPTPATAPISAPAPAPVPAPAAASASPLTEAPAPAAALPSPMTEASTPAPAPRLYDEGCEAKALYLTRGYSRHRFDPLAHARFDPTALWPRSRFSGAGGANSQPPPHRGPRRQSVYHARAAPSLQRSLEVAHRPSRPGRAAEGVTPFVTTPRGLPVRQRLISRPPAHPSRQHAVDAPMTPLCGSAFQRSPPLSRAQMSKVVEYFADALHQEDLPRQTLAQEHGVFTRWTRRPLPSERQWARSPASTPAARSYRLAPCRPASVGLTIHQPLTSPRAMELSLGPSHGDQSHSSRELCSMHSPLVRD